MNDLSKKLDAFVDSVIAETVEESAKIISELQARRDEEVLKYKEALRAEVKLYLESKKAEITSREARRVSAVKNRNHHVLLQFREDCAKEVFAAAQEKIREFTKSEAYAPHLARLLQMAIEHLGYGFAAVVRLRPEDMGLAQTLLESTSGVSLRFEEAALSLGGLRLVCPAKGLRVDLSFDTAIADKIGHFSELSGITL